MFGLRLEGGAEAGAAFWACANAPEVSAAAATNVDVPSKMFRRLRAPSSAFFEGVSNGSLSLLIELSIFQVKDESHFGPARMQHAFVALPPSVPTRTTSGTGRMTHLHIDLQSHSH
jgi:hypothetical protein